MTDDNEGLTRYAGSSLDHVADQLAEAWRVLSNPDDGDGKGNIPTDWQVGYVDDEWSKTTRRMLRGWAETHARPTHWPWTDKRFDIFKWGSAAP